MEWDDLLTSGAYSDFVWCHYLKHQTYATFRNYLGRTMKWHELVRFPVTMHRIAEALVTRCFPSHVRHRTAIRRVTCAVGALARVYQALHQSGVCHACWGLLRTIVGIAALGLFIIVVISGIIIYVTIIVVIIVDVMVLTLLPIGAR